MGEAFIWYRGRDTVDPELLKPTTITTNTNYTAPITGTYRVYTVGGGGGGGGGCRNAWNVSQVFYGSAGTRGTLNIISVNLNKGDNVTCTIGAAGAAGTNNTTRTAYSNGTWNSRGTSGTAGGASSFGIYGSGAGGSAGLYSWSRTYWSNVNMGWNNYSYWNNSLKWNNTYYNYVGQKVYYNGTADAIPTSLTYASLYDRSTNAYLGSTQLSYFGKHDGETSNPSKISKVSDWINFLYEYDSTAKCLITLNTYYYSQWRNASYWSKVSNTSASGPYKMIHTFNCVSDFKGLDATYGYWYGLYEAVTSESLNLYGYINILMWNNTIKWNNSIQNTTTRCYTSIQTGSWWYLNNNTVTTSGTRIYKGDGGNSGRAGNAGYILVIPPQS